MTLQVAENLERDGFAIIPSVLGTRTVAALIDAVSKTGNGAGSQRRGSVYALRNLLEAVPAVAELADAPAVRALVIPMPGSHRGGRLTAPEIQRQRTQTSSVACPVPSGGALLMRPLLLHASAASQSPRHRRVIHLEYAADSLPGSLQWHRNRQETAA